jgi:hypothetical protein
MIPDWTAPPWGEQGSSREFSGSSSEIHLAGGVGILRIAAMKAGSPHMLDETRLATPINSSSGSGFELNHPRATGCSAT